MMNECDGCKSLAMYPKIIQLFDWTRNLRIKYRVWYKQDTKLTKISCYSKYSAHRHAVCVDLEANLSLVSLGHHVSQKKQNALHIFCKMDELNFVESSWSEMSRSPYVLVTFSGDTNCSWWRGSCRLDSSSEYLFSGCAGMYARTAEEASVRE